MKLLEEQLRELKIKRENPVGKRVGSDVWMHKDYAGEILKNDGYNVKKAQLPKDFDFTIVRFNKKSGDMAFIESPDFDSANEPLVGKSIVVSENDDGFNIKVTEPSRDNPFVYHSKWTMVKDDYSGFDVELSKKRTLAWKSIIGVDKSITSRIGRLKFWEDFLNKNKLEKRMRNESSPFDIYYKNRFEQSVDSAATARNQRPKTVGYIEKTGISIKDKIVLDIGCGRQNEKTAESVSELGGIYHGIDPFNQPHENNIKNIEKCGDGKTDLVLLNNVFNVIPFEEEDIHLNILQQAKSALKEGGSLYICIYEGEKTSEEKKLEKQLGIKISKKPIKTRDGYQNRMKSSEYLDRIQTVFPNARIEKGIIVATKESPKPKNDEENSKKRKGYGRKI